MENYELWTQEVQSSSPCGCIKRLLDKLVLQDRDLFCIQTLEVQMKLSGFSYKNH